MNYEDTKIAMVKEMQERHYGQDTQKKCLITLNQIANSSKSAMTPIYKTVITKCIATRRQYAHKYIDSPACLFTGEGESMPIYTTIRLLCIGLSGFC